VFYRIEGRTIQPIYNEKVLAGLGRTMTPSHRRLSPEGRREALRALRRFQVLIEARRPDQTLAVATYAVRDAEDGQEFVEEVMRETGLKLRIVTGEEEANYSAMGVLAGWPGAEGVVGDLGGSSLELVRLSGGMPHEGVSLPLGPFSLGAPGPYDAAVVRRMVHEQLAGSAERFRSRTFHAVGGAWRSLAFIHMDYVQHPLRIAHHYEIDREGALKIAQLVAGAHSSKKSLEVKGVSKKRIDTLPYAATVMMALVEQLDIERIWVSAYGLREGLLFETMPPDQRARDPLVEGCARISEHMGGDLELGSALAEWIKPLLDFLPPVMDEREPILWDAACRLADIGVLTQPDRRAELTFEQVLGARIAGLSHRELAFLAVAIFARYGGMGDTQEPQVIRRFLTKDPLERARTLGAAMRLGCDLCGRVPELLRQCRLRIEEDALVLSAVPPSPALLDGEQTIKRAQALADRLRLKVAISNAAEEAPAEPRRSFQWGVR
jgi:exopolyphosphatase/guanosine-5'-triphosphate,3'-diphosphate pyrophosphatase